MLLFKVDKSLYSIVKFLEFDIEVVRFKRCLLVDFTVDKLLWYKK